MLGTLSAFAYRHRETKKNLCMIKGRLPFKVPNLKLKEKHLKRIHVKREMTGWERCHMEKEGRKGGERWEIRKARRM